uniref:Uncharacterized protein n=1 Tax=Acrobeloides nanus TaxID=290746 RepID=A0A914CNE4_9BILA
MEEIVDSEENVELVKKIAALANFSKMDTILKQNDDLIANLLKIQKSKLYEMHKYKQIMNMPAKNVHAYLKKEFEKPTKVLSKEEEFQEIVERERAKVKNEAAKVIQRNLRRFVLKRKHKRVYQNWTQIDMKEKAELIEKISERLANQKVMPRTDLQVIKTKLAQHKSHLKKEAELYVKREQLLESIKKNIEFFEERLEEERILYADLNFNDE